MFKKFKGNCLLLLTSFTSLSAFAHPGHDNQSSLAFFVHLVWLAPVIFAAYIAINFFKNKKFTNKK